VDSNRFSPASETRISFQRHRWPFIQISLFRMLQTYGFGLAEFGRNSWLDTKRK
jgi:hypothetical protein